MTEPQSRRLDSIPRCVGSFSSLSRSDRLIFAGYRERASSVHKCYVHSSSAVCCHRHLQKRVVWKQMYDPRAVVWTQLSWNTLRTLGWDSPNSGAMLRDLLHGSHSTAVVMAYSLCPYIPWAACIHVRCSCCNSSLTRTLLQSSKLVSFQVSLCNMQPSTYLHLVPKVEKGWSCGYILSCCHTITVLLNRVVFWIVTPSCGQTQSFSVIGCFRLHG
jgi:hypothetical protein